MAKKKATVHTICAFCHKAEATITLEARVPGVPNSTSTWPVCESCAIAVLERLTGVPAKPESEARP